MIKNERQLVLDALLQVYKKKAYSGIVLEKLIPAAMKHTGRAFITSLFYGVIERDITLEYIADRYSKRKCKTLDLEVALILKMGIYQLCYMDRVPDNAAVDESVSLCGYARKTSAKGLVNAVLHAFIREDKKLVLKESDHLKSLSIAYSCPEWLVCKWDAEYGYDTTKGLLKASVGRPPLTIRVNTLKTDEAGLVQKLESAGVTVLKSPYLENCLHIAGTGNLEAMREFQDGLFYVQDLSSQFCAKLADARRGMVVFDMCAAPGSKSFTMAQYMQGEGRIMAYDLHAHKLELIRKTAEKLGICCIMEKLADASVYQPDLGLADLVLCDVPCAGLGVIRRKPEIKYKDPETLKGLPELQYRILDNASRYVEKGGRLVYSTCSLNREENEQVAGRFLNEHPEFCAVPIPQEISSLLPTEGNMVTFLPHLIGSDGFFAALFERCD